MGPAVTKVWNSPRSPHGSTDAGGSASNCSSKSRPANDRSSWRGSTQVIVARSPTAIILRARSSAHHLDQSDLGRATRRDGLDIGGWRAVLASVGIGPSSPGLGVLARAAALARLVAAAELEVLGEALLDEVIDRGV